jgi:hypothetical protein
MRKPSGSRPTTKPSASTSVASSVPTLTTSAAKSSSKREVVSQAALPLAPEMTLPSEVAVRRKRARITVDGPSDKGFNLPQAIPLPRPPKSQAREKEKRAPTQPARSRATSTASSPPRKVSPPPPVDVCRPLPPTLPSAGQSFLGVLTNPVKTILPDPSRKAIPKSLKRTISNPPKITGHDWIPKAVDPREKDVLSTKWDAANDKQLSRSTPQILLERRSRRRQATLPGSSSAISQLPPPATLATSPTIVQHVSPPLPSSPPPPPPPPSPPPPVNLSPSPRLVSLSPSPLPPPISFRTMPFIPPMDDGPPPLAPKENYPLRFDKGSNPFPNPFQETSPMAVAPSASFSSALAAYEKLDAAIEEHAQVEAEVIRLLESDM